MKVSFPEINFEGESSSDIIFLKNQNLWFFFSPKIKSRYFGLFLSLNNQSFRILDDIHFDEEIKEIQILKPAEVILVFSNKYLHIRLNPDAIEFKFSTWMNICLTFDIKDIFENEPLKRKINFEKLSSCRFVVKESLEENEIIKLLIESDAPLEENNTWQEKIMNFDQKRNSPPYNWWVYNGLYGKTRELKIKIVYPEIQIQNINIVKKTEKPLIDFLLRRIESLYLNNYLPAGFPWFFENWYRDELLTLFLLKNFFQENFFERRIEFYLYNLKDLWDKNKNEKFIISADTLLLVLINLNLNILKIYSFYLETTLKNWQKKFSSYLPPLSTWMDTLERKSAIEIDALYLNALEKFSHLKKEYLILKNTITQNLKEKIKNNPEDINLIFVYLYTPKLFTSKEWKKFFQKLLNNNFLNWGGLSSIPKDHPQFIPEDDGELAKAYHHGDSWYYLNNLAVFCLKKIDEKSFQKEIQKIIYSSLTDLFLDGALGWSSEISSAKERKSEGSLVQLWSISSLILLLSSLQNIDILLKSFSNSHNIISIKS